MHMLDTIRNLGPNVESGNGWLPTLSSTYARLDGMHMDVLYNTTIVWLGSRQY